MLFTLLKAPPITPGAFLELENFEKDVVSESVSFFEPVTLLSSSRNLCKSVVSFRICLESSSGAMTDIQNKNNLICINFFSKNHAAVIVVSLARCFLQVSQFVKRPGDSDFDQSR